MLDHNHHLTILPIIICFIIHSITITTQIQATTVPQLYAWGQDLWGQTGVFSGIANAGNTQLPTPTPMITTAFPTTVTYAKFVEGLSYYSNYMLVKDSPTTSNATILMGCGLQDYLPNFSTGSSFYKSQRNLIPMTLANCSDIVDMINGYSCRIVACRDDLNPNNLTLYSWGQSACLGDGNSTDRGVVSAPVKVIIPEHCYGVDYLKQISIFEHVLMLCQDDSGQYLYGFGTNNYNSLTINLPSTVYTPTLIDISPLSGKVITKVAVGSSFSIILTSDSSVYVVGRVLYCFSYSILTKITGLPIDTNSESIVDLSVSAYHIMMLTSTSKIIVYGNSLLSLGAFIPGSGNHCGSTVLTSQIYLGSKPTKVMSYTNTGNIVVMSNNNELYTINGTVGSQITSIPITNDNFISDATSNTLGYFVAISNYMYCNGISYSDSNVCSGHGSCIAQSCICSPGYYGRNCEEFTCFGKLRASPSVCNGRGVCSDYNTCQCTDEYFGDSCEYSLCFKNMNNGINSKRLLASSVFCKRINKFLK